MRRTMMLLSGVTLAVSIGRTSAAQTVVLSPGARVRVTSSSFNEPHIGVATFVSDTMLLITSRRDTTRIFTRTITGIDVSTSRTRPTWSKTAPLWLTAAAAATGAAVGQATTPSDDLMGPGFGAAAGGIIGGLVGLLAGTVIAIEVVHETWVPVTGGVSQRTSAAPKLYVAPRASGVSVGLHATF